MVNYISRAVTNVACERYSSQSVTVIRIEVSGFTLATH